MSTIGLGIPLLIILVIIIVAGALYWDYRRSLDILGNWASRNGYRVIQAERRYFNQGPFFWTTSKGQTVFRVEVQDSYGYTRSGWVRCGSWWWGLLSDQAEVRWDS